MAHRSPHVVVFPVAFFALGGVFVVAVEAPFASFLFYSVVAITARIRHTDQLGTRRVPSYRLP